MKLHQITDPTKVPSWHWGTPEGSRDFDRLGDRMLTFREKVQWLEDAETLALNIAKKTAKPHSPTKESGVPPNS